MFSTTPSGQSGKRAHEKEGAVPSRFVLEFILTISSVIGLSDRAPEANAVVLNFVRLPPADQQAILDFLRSL